MKNKIILRLWISFVVIILLIAVVVVSAWNGWICNMPDFKTLQNPVDEYASMVYSADGKLIGQYNVARANRLAADFQDLSPYLVEALVATEDERFYEHSGIDAIGLGRAILKRGIMGDISAGGGSTITQQLAKMLYSERATSVMDRLFQKPVEWLIAIKLERQFTKEEIITMYLNQFNFLNGAYGIKTAADIYFKKKPNELTRAECALFIGMCKNPSYFNPRRYLDRAIGRRNVVLHQMLKAGFVTQEEYDKDCQEGVNLKQFKLPTHKGGIAPYFREYLRHYMMAEEPKRENYPSWQKVQYCIDSVLWQKDPLFGWCNKHKKSNGENYNIYTDGLKIYTSIDTRMQKYAEEAVFERVVKELQPQFNTFCKALRYPPFNNAARHRDIENCMKRSWRNSERYNRMKKAGATEEEIALAYRTPVNMKIFTYDGTKEETMTPEDSIRYMKKFLKAGFVSMDPKTGDVKAYVGGTNFDAFSYDMAGQGRRQVGSTMKPFLYSLMVQNGMSPCDPVSNVRKSYGGWMPRGGGGGGSMQLQRGLAQSNNTVTAHLMSTIDPRDFLSWLELFELPTFYQIPNMALCLGPLEISVLSLISGYTTFVNDGLHMSPRLVTKITDQQGNLIAEFSPRMNEILSQESAWKMQIMLMGVVKHGTGRRLLGMGFDGDIGGKTGTTNDCSDFWYVGITPNLVSGGWVGGDERDIRFSTGQGAEMSLPMWAKYMKKVYDDESLGYSMKDTFNIPKGYDGCDKRERIKKERNEQHEIIDNISDIYR
ncbi:MAG: transglycosylase domain-containing protein [Bacteroidaceae bacterium]|nr:transglycosylase domain-containing protein [Bacteroidaceae bacterium]